LQEAQIGVEREPGDADDGQRAGFCGDDGKSDRPPGNIAVSQEVVAQAALCFAEAQSEDRDCCQIQRNDGQVDRIEAVNSDLPSVCLTGATSSRLDGRGARRHVSMPRNANRIFSYL
jgi:hypothetical protein